MTTGRRYSIQAIRDNYILRLDEAENKTQMATSNADELFNLGLTMYSRNYSFDSLIYNSFAQSELDEKISLHPEQLKVIKKFIENEGTIFSAPTSFGKTFTIFEYIAREKPNNIVLVVPTLALVEEYNKNIIKKYEEVFREYNVYLSVDAEKIYDFSVKNIFILTHDRIVDETNHECIKEIDLLVIDEVYKLQKSEDDRVLVLNLAYYYLVRKAKKHILLAPFIGGIENRDKLIKKPAFIKTDFSPVVNEVKTYDILDESDRFDEVNRILNEIGNTEKTLVYFPTVYDISKFIKNDIENYNFLLNDVRAIVFIKWLKQEIHEEWYLVKAMEQGYLIHNGQLPIGIRMYQLNLFATSENYNKMLCTSTLLEGVNTTTKHIIISKPSRTGRENDIFDAFDFYNLVGRSGRLFKHYLGIAHYIKGPNDPTYIKEQAIKRIEFEITQESEDMGIFLEEGKENEAYKRFLEKLGITHEVYKKEIGAKYRFATVRSLYLSYIKRKSKLLTELSSMYRDNKKGRYWLVLMLYEIYEGDGNRLRKLYANIINTCLNKNRYSVRKIIEEVRDRTTVSDINIIINSTLKLKSSYIEYDFYSKTLLIMFFMKCENVEAKYIDIIDSKIKENIEYVFFIDSKPKRMLKDLGIYDADIPKILGIIGEDIEDAFHLKRLLASNIQQLSDISIISKEVINALIK